MNAGKKNEMKLFTGSVLHKVGRWAGWLLALYQFAEESIEILKGGRDSTSTPSWWSVSRPSPLVCMGALPMTTWRRVRN
ncbi:MAG: hypothetical protein ACM3SR_13045 [Ignavibacteriales bacterium]